jgi:AcrR family transcriptional regulator
MTKDESVLTRSVGLRADAARNRQQIVESARKAFAEAGLDVAMETIARKAGVGTATLYRRFPRRDDLVEACMADRMVAYVAAAKAALADPDPWGGFVGFLTVACEMQANDRGVNDLLIRSLPSSPSLEGPRRVASLAMQKVMKRAQVLGKLRRDVGIDDIPLLLMANAGVVLATFGAAPDAWRRVLGITVDGLRAEASTTLSAAPTHHQLERAMAQVVRASRHSSSTTKGDFDAELP